MGVYGVALAGWSSNSKYPLLGGLRSSAQMISYELALTMSVVGVILMAGTFNLSEIVNSQQGFHWGFVPRWNLIGSPMPQILGFFLFFTAAVAETNRAPFDLAEAESELVAGFHTEYASFKFAMFFMAEYASMITVSCLATILFFGGWLSPFPQTPLFAWTHYIPAAAFGLAGLALIVHGVRYITVFGRIVLPVLGARPVRPWSIIRPARRDRICSGTVLVSAEDRDFPVYLRLGARHASAFPLRSVDEFRMEGAAAAFDPERGDHEPGDCADTTMRAESKKMTLATRRGTLEGRR